MLDIAEVLVAEFPLQTEIYRMPQNRQQISSCQSLCRRPSSGTRYAFFGKPAFLITLGSVYNEQLNLYKCARYNGYSLYANFSNTDVIRSVLFREKINSL